MGEEQALGLTGRVPSDGQRAGAWRKSVDYLFLLLAQPPLCQMILSLNKSFTSDFTREFVSLGQYFWTLMWLGKCYCFFPLSEHIPGPWASPGHTFRLCPFSHNLVCCCCCSVTKLCPTLCNPVDCSTLGFLVLHFLPEFAQTHVHWVGDIILYVEAQFLLSFRLLKM